MFERCAELNWLAPLDESSRTSGRARTPVAHAGWAANAALASTGPPHGLSNVPLGGPFDYRAHVSNVAGIRMFSARFTIQVGGAFSARSGGGKVSGELAEPLVTSFLAGANRRSASGSPFWLSARWVQAAPAREASPIGPGHGSITPRLAAWACRMFPRLHRADTCAACLAPSLGTVQPAPVTDSTVCRLSFRSIAVIAAAAVTSIALHFEVVKADETVKASIGRAQDKSKDLGAALLARREPPLRSGSR